ncbi:MAG: hypothetical protein ACK5EI_09430, partial [Bacteroidota bacterium]
MTAVVDRPAKTVTITGTSTGSGTSNYTITTSGHISPCTAATISGSVTVSAASPSISGAATASVFTTTYGTQSSPQSFAISGSNLTANITATAPTGFEVSSDGTNYNSTATFTQSAGNASGTLRIRLAATAPVNGTYNNQNIALVSAGATPINITTAASGNIVNRKTLTVTAENKSKSYDGVAYTSFTNTITGYVNSESSAAGQSGSVSYGGGATTAVNAGSYSITVDVSGLSSTNYTYVAGTSGTLTISKVQLTVTAD